MAWRRPGDKPLSEPMMVRLPTHICVTRPQWVKTCGMKLRLPSKTSTMQSLKFGNGEAILSHALPRLWFLNHAGINSIHVGKWGPGVKWYICYTVVHFLIGFSTYTEANCIDICNDYFINSLRPSDAYMRRQTNHDWTAPSHYQNQCLNNVIWTLSNKLQWNFSRKSNIFVQKNAHLKMSSAL